MSEECGYDSCDMVMGVVVVVMVMVMSMMARRLQVVLSMQ